MRQNITFKILILIITGIFVFSCSQGSGENEIKNQSTKDSSLTKTDSTVKQDPGKVDPVNPDINLIPVEVTTIKTGDISDFILLSSNLETEVMADVFSRVQGIVEGIYKEEGSYVKKGDVMLSLEAKEYELAEEKANVEYQQQLSNYKRLEAMHEKNLLSDDEFEKAKFTMEGAKIQWDEAKLNLDYTKIKSPITGRVGERLTKQGARIQPTDKLFSVVDNSQVIAVVYVPEKHLNKLEIGQKAIIYSENLKDTHFKGWIKRISPVVDPASGTFKVTVGVENTNNMLRPGMFVNVEIITETHNDVVLIPKTAIVYENEYMNVYVVRDSIARKIRLQPGFEDNQKVESLNEIKSGEQVIVVGQSGMKDETPVKIVSERKNTIGIN
jgi:membrane fusion protein (multidrug efflux system)